MLFRALERCVAAIRAPLAVKLQAGFLLVIALLLVTGVVTLLAIAGIRQQALDRDGMDEAVHLAAGLDHSIVLQEHLSSMFLLTGDEAYWGKLLGEQLRFRGLLGKLAAHGATFEEIAGIEDAFALYETAVLTVRDMRLAGNTHQAQQVHVIQEHTAAHQIEILTKAMVARMNTALQAGGREILVAQRHATWTVAACFVVSVALALLLGSVLARSILDPVRRVDGALDRIASGEFVTVSDVANRDELGSLVGNVNQMSRRLADLYAKEHRTATALQEQIVALGHAQAQLRQAQKMEAVGRLAGGVAHDFNNLMTVIGGRATLVLDQMRPEDPASRHLDLIRKTTNRATGLTRQLLVFSRKQVLQPKVLDLNQLVDGIVPMLERLIGEHIDLVTRPDRSVGRVKADPTQMEQVILNLAVNARDAMSNGGTLTLAISERDAEEVPGDDPVRGSRGVTLVITDTGVGMTPEVQSHLFEPFFTTKEVGKGTGLGLATVYGIVKQSDGHVWIASEPGLGTTATIWLPRVEDVPDVVPGGPGSDEPQTGRETILLVEDEAEVRDLTREILIASGYTVLEARDGEDALHVAADQRAPIDLVLTDVVMPRLGGRELVRRLVVHQPDLKILYMSGYTDDALGDHGVLEPGAVLLQKPFMPHELARKVRQVLEGELVAAGA